MSASFCIWIWDSSYVVEASNTVNATPLAYKDAVKIAAQHGYQQWQMAMGSHGF